MIYRAPLSVDLSNKQRDKVFLTRRLAGAVRYGKWSARRYATTLLRQEGTNLVERAGGSIGIENTMRTYLVMPAVVAYAAREVVRLLEEKGRA
jgi:hypothetical protein